MVRDYGCPVGGIPGAGVGSGVDSASSFVVNYQIFNFRGLLGTPDVEDIDRLFMHPVVNPTRFDPDLTIVFVVKFLYGATEADKVFELVGC